jgi:hypothetical protein
MKVTSDSLIYSLMNEVNTDSIESNIQSLQDFGTRFMIAPNRKTIAQWIRDKFATFGIEDIRIDSILCSTSINFWNLHYDTTTWQYNVIATIPGSVNVNEYFVLGAHYDDIVAPNGDPMVFAPGADDNASGVAALFEIARIMILNNYLPKTNIEFVAFGAEELMYYGESGSQGYVLNAGATEMNINLMINNDMIANSLNTDWKIKVSNYTGCEWLTQMTEYVAETYTQIQPVVSEPANNADGDCRYFYQQDIPCVYLMENDFNTYYHSENDITDNCEFDYCAEAIKVSLGVLINADFPIVGTREKSLEYFVNLHPNPTSGAVIVNLNKNLLFKNPIYQILSLSGSIIEMAKITSTDQYIVQFNNLPEGFYFVRITTDDFVKTFKVVVRR